MASGIKFEFKGFDEMLENIQNADGSIKSSVDNAMKESSKIVYNELKNQMSRSGPKPVDSALINSLPAPVITWEGNYCSAKVGYKKGSYDPNNLSDGFKAVFINYGTPRISPREFIKATKKKAAPQVKKKQKQVLSDILKELQT